MCVGTEYRVVPLTPPAPLLRAHSVPVLSVAVDAETRCAERYTGTFVGISSQRLVDTAHFVSAGIVGFARGLNDTPKIAALLLAGAVFDVQWAAVLIALVMALGGVLNARRIAETMSHRITAMNHGQGFAANLATGILVIGASVLGLPVSTTHVSVGALFGIGLATRQANPDVMSAILLSWFATLPCAVAISAIVYWGASRV